MDPLRNPHLVMYRLARFEGRTLAFRVNIGNKMVDQIREYDASGTYVRQMKDQKSIGEIAGRMKEKSKSETVQVEHLGDRLTLSAIEDLIQKITGKEVK